MIFKVHEPSRSFKKVCHNLFEVDFCVCVSDDTAQARNCHRVWSCKGDIRCWEDCKNQHNGKGLCDLYTAPSVPKQCFCAYKC